MTHLILGTAHHEQMTQLTLSKMHKLRHTIFYEKLGWNVSVANGEEHDEYDALNPYYMVALDNGEAVACWRLLPSQGPYMLSNTFRDLLRGELLPKTNKVWELSRFAVLSPTQQKKGQIRLNAVAFEMFEKLIEFADENMITQYITVMSTSVERLMQSTGISLRRFGDKKSSDIDGIRSVACWIDLDERTRSAVAHAVSGTKMALS